MTKVRIDIQALRGFAVLMVVLYHAKVGPTQNGYLGVDVFFVISGYLITTLVARGIARGDFSLVDFYFRRAKRLLPAAYVTIAVTALIAPWFLNQQELHDFSGQVIGAISFTSNFVLWQQSGYFEGASDLKPLLHVWSLSLEEQYYMLLPAVLLLTRSPLWMRIVTTALIASMLLCIIGVAIKPVATFYLLPTRAWELLLGSFGALWVINATAASKAVGDSVIVRWLYYPSFACLMLSMVHSFGDRHPGIDAFLVCLSTLVIIL